MNKGKKPQDLREEQVEDREASIEEAQEAPEAVLEQEEEIPAAKEQEEELNTKYLRLMADFQNYKRRSEKEKSEIYTFANKKLVSELLNVIDNFERALSHEGDASASYTAGMEMILKQFKEVLLKAGVEEISALGVDFDPNLHHAVMTEATEAYESGKVCEVMQKGYKLNDKVIRPSMVKVSQ